MPFTSKVANDLLWTPFDNKCVNDHQLFDKITEKTFLDECFSKPFFENSSLLEDNLGLFDDYPLTADDIIYSINEEKGKYQTFLNWLTMFENHKVYTLSGNSGTGKTTFLYYLKNTVTKYEWTILDVSNTPEKFDWLGDISTTVKRYDRATRKTLTAILNAIHKKLFDVDSDSKKTLKIYNNLNGLISNYEKRFKDSYITGCSLFTKLCEIFSVSESTRFEKVTQSAMAFRDHFHNDENSDDYELLDKTMDVLLLILRCTDDCIDKQHIIAFDNFERFVTEDEIYNEEINEIRKKLANYDLRVNKKNNHSLKFKFIMAMRCSTARICGIKLQPTDEDPSDIDISSWFNIEDIINKKTTWYRKINIENEDFSLIKQITGDLRKCKNGEITGLKLFIDPLFNDNKRLTIDFLGIIIENKKNDERYNYLASIEKYKKNWELNTSISRCAARNILKGLILYKLKNIDDFFKNIKDLKETDNSDLSQMGTGLARRILTIIYNKTTTTNEEILLSDVVSELYSTNRIVEKWREDSYATKRKSLSQIIYHMAFCNRRENDWIQFVDLQHDETDKKLKIKNVREMESMLFYDFEKLHISIMPAGVAYLRYIVASFEYFSVRYVKNYQPLFAMVPDENIMQTISDVTSLPCYKTIKAVKKQSLLCIENIRDNNLKIKSKNGGLTHAQRIIDFHSFYLDNFICYLQEFYVDNDKTPDEAKSKYKQLINKIQEIKLEYKDCKKEEFK